jgi:hypothetical protein
LGSGFLDADDFLPGLLLKEKEARVGEQIGTATEQRGQQRQPLPLTHCAGIYLGAETRSLSDVELARALPLLASLLCVIIIIIILIIIIII